MPMNDQDARALTYLARRLRTETNGACEWDEAGVFSVVSSLIGQQLATSVERITRHAADPEAKTPGAINRPFVPDAQGPQRPREPKPEEAVCACGRVGYHRHADTDYRAPETAEKIRAAREAIAKNAPNLTPKETP